MRKLNLEERSLEKSGRKRMKTKLLSRRRNDLLRREEITFEITHEEGGTPSRLQVRNLLAATVGVSVNCVYLRKMETRTGSTITVGDVNVYDSPDEAKHTEPNFLISRNVSKGKSKESE